MHVPDVSIIVVSYNTRELTTACLRSVYEQAGETDFEVLVVDNASTDGSAEAIAEAAPAARLFALEENLGFAAANNLATGHARGRHLLLLNPDTVVLDRAIQRLVRFADANPRHGIYGGRTVFADGRLNRTSCWARPTVWSLCCHGLGLAALAKKSSLFNPEGYGAWRRDCVREVDIVTGCLLLIQRDLWQRLGGFDPAFFMYGEDADLCLRARRAGAQPVITPDAEIVHLGGQSERIRAEKVVRLLTARVKLLRRHWPRPVRPLGRALHELWVLRRYLVWSAARRLGVEHAAANEATFRDVWRRRGEWGAAVG